MPRLLTLAPLRTLAVAAIASAAAFAPLQARAQAQPPNTIRIVVGYPAGQSIDMIARNYAVALQRELGQPVYVDNRPGANGILGAQEVKRAAADGKTLLFGTSGQLAINPSLYKKLPYDTTKDFAPVAMLSQGPLVLVATPSFAAGNVAELVAMAKARPGLVNFGSGGQGITAHLAMEIFADAAGIKLQHVPYKGSPAALTDVMGGTIPMMFEPLNSAIPHIKAGRLKALGITSAKRNPQLPNVPTLAEQGLKNFEVLAWAAVVVPAGTPEAEVQKLNGALKRAAESKEVVESMQAIGVESNVTTSAQFAGYLQSELKQWNKAVTAAGVQLDN